MCHLTVQVDDIDGVPKIRKSKLSFSHILRGQSSLSHKIRMTWSPNPYLVKNFSHFSPVTYAKKWLRHFVTFTHVDPFDAALTRGKRNSYPLDIAYIYKRIRDNALKGFVRISFLLVRFRILLG